MLIWVKADDVRSGRKANARHGRLYSSLMRFTEMRFVHFNIVNYAFNEE